MVDIQDDLGSKCRDRSFEANLFSELSRDNLDQKSDQNLQSGTEIMFFEVNTISKVIGIHPTGAGSPQNRISVQIRNS